MNLKCKVEFLPDQFDEFDTVKTFMEKQGWEVSKESEYKVKTIGKSRTVSKEIVFTITVK
jgi:hypothetical protein